MKTSFEIEVYEETNILRVKENGKTVWAPRFENIWSALTEIGNEIYSKGLEQKSVSIKIINTKGGLIQPKVFKVVVIDCNRETFLYHYDKYITDEERLPYGDSLFTLEATSDVYDEIKTLKEEGIEIVEEIVE